QNVPMNSRAHGAMFWHAVSREASERLFNKAVPERRCIASDCLEPIKQPLEKRKWIPLFQCQLPSVGFQENPPPNPPSSRKGHRSKVTPSDTKSISLRPPARCWS
ncbi:hypothetical protein KUCAC02_033691, partial [Chaenocephalus aceratus]